MKDGEASLGKLVQYWPLVAAMGLGAMGYLKLSFTVDQLSVQADTKSKSLDAQREKRSEEMELVRTRITKLEDRVYVKDH